MVHEPADAGRDGRARLQETNFPGADKGRGEKMFSLLASYKQNCRLMPGLPNVMRTPLLIPGRKFDAQSPVIGVITILSADGLTCYII